MSWSSGASILATRRYGCGGTGLVPFCRGDPPQADLPYARLSPLEVQLDKMYVKQGGEMVYLWRAVDHESEISKVTSRKPGTRKRRFAA